MKNSFKCFLKRNMLNIRCKSKIKQKIDVFLLIHRRKKKNTIIK